VAPKKSARPPLLLLIRLRRRRRVIIPLGGLLGSLWVLVVAGLVSRIDVIRRPYLQNQVPILDLLPREFLQTA
jgi:hypothetical protein